VSLKAGTRSPGPSGNRPEVALEIEKESIIGSQKLTDSVLEFSAKRGVK